MVKKILESSKVSLNKFNICSFNFSFPKHFISFLNTKHKLFCNSNARTSERQNSPREFCVSSSVNCHCTSAAARSRVNCATIRAQTVSRHKRSANQIDASLSAGNLNAVDPAWLFANVHSSGCSSWHAPTVGSNDEAEKC